MARRKKLITEQQVLKLLRINNLRGIKDLELSFEGNPVTGIFGLNGSGKTTVLQTVVCLFRSKDEKENTKMSRFFKYTTAANKWIGSSYEAVVDYIQLAGRKRIQQHNKLIKYSKPGSEWSPRQASKPDRHVIFISLSDSVPDIEKISAKRVTFIPSEGAELDKKIARAATQIMGIDYQDLKISKIDKLDCFTVNRNGTLCHSLNLGAGEQKVFRILQRIYRAPAYSLIIIDEIDLTLHTAALRELIHVMLHEARQETRQLQIVFTSHRQELMRNAEFNIRFLLNTPQKTFCLDNPTEQCYEQLSGTPEQYLKVYVEDDIAEAIIQRCMEECRMSTHYLICKFGSITNSVRLALGLSCQFEDLSKMDDTVFFCDGDDDNFTTESKLRQQIDRTLSGGEPSLQAKRDKVLQIIKHFCPAENNGKKQHPEEFIHNALNLINENDQQQCLFPEIVIDSKSILNVVDHHDYVKKLTDKGHYLQNIVLQVSKSSLWDDYVRDVKQWINERKKAHNIIE